MSTSESQSFPALWCPICEQESPEFSPYGIIPRPNALCPHCQGMERHRLVWLYFKNCTDLFDHRPKRILHVAPETCFKSRLEKHLGAGYISADLNGWRGEISLDITNIQFPSQFFDAIYCSHVLEHVEDDRKALSEFHRVLKPHGWAILMVPINAAQTLEDPSVVDPQERLRLFGQSDHVRRYGVDFIDRLREAQFDVKVADRSDLAEPADVKRMALNIARDRVYFCTKS